MKNKSPWIILVAVVIALLGTFSVAQAQLSPPPDGGYPNGNTAEGDNALFNLTTGSGNTAVGDSALFSNSVANFNTALGASTLVNNDTGNFNVAVGVQALLSNTSGFRNTAVGGGALASNTTADRNTAIGINALGSTTTGRQNTAIGFFALGSNTTGRGNIAVGGMGSNTTGSSNVAIGGGNNLTTGNNNLDIWNDGVAGESNTIRIGDQTVQTTTFIAGINGVDKASGQPVFIDANGQLGTGNVNSAMWPSGSILQMQPGSTPPPGFTKIGTEQAKLYDLNGHPSEVTWDVYQKN